MPPSRKASLTSINPVICDSINKITHELFDQFLPSDHPPPDLLFKSNCHHYNLPEAFQSNLSSSLGSFHPEDPSTNRNIPSQNAINFKMAICSKLANLSASANHSNTQPGDTIPIDEAGMQGFWICCHCEHVNNPDMSPTRCGHCAHTKNYCCQTSRA